MIIDKKMKVYNFLYLFLLKFVKISINDESL